MKPKKEGGWRYYKRYECFKCRAKLEGCQLIYGEDCTNCGNYDLERDRVPFVVVRYRTRGALWWKQTEKIGDIEYRRIIKNPISKGGVNE